MKRRNYDELKWKHSLCAKRTGTKHLTFSAGVKRLRSHWLSLKGRSTRKEYWLIGLCIYILVGLALNIASIILFFILPGIRSNLITTPVTLALIYMNFALSVRRLHDIGYSGWYALLAYIPLINLFFLYLTVKPSVPDNKYGPQWEETKYWPAHISKRKNTVAFSFQWKRMEIPKKEYSFFFYFILLQVFYLSLFP